MSITPPNFQPVYFHRDGVNILYCKCATGFTWFNVATPGGWYEAQLGLASSAVSETLSVYLFAY